MFTIGAHAKLVVGWAAMIVLVALAGGTASAQQTEPSDRSVRVLMDYAWRIVPSKFTAPTGEVINVDKTKREENTVSIDIAREVIRVANVSAEAQSCGMIDQQVMNYNTLMRVVRKENELTPQQLLYISQLHLFTTLSVSGQIKIVDDSGEKDVVVENTAQAQQPEACSDERKASITNAVVSYVCRVAPQTVKGGCENIATQ